MAFSGGELLTHLLYYKQRYKTRQTLSIENTKNQPIDNSLVGILCLCILLGVLAIHYYYETVRLAIIAGYKSGPFMLMYARIAIYDLFETRDRLASYAFHFAKACGYIFSFIFLYNQIFFKPRYNIKNILPLLFFVIYMILTKVRGDFIALIGFWLVVGFTLLMQKNYWNTRYNIKIIFFSFLGVIGFLFIFILVGLMKSEVYLNMPLETISFYTGLSIPSLNDYIVHPRPPNVFFGEHTLFSFYNILRKFGFDYPRFSVPYEMVFFNGTKGNVYTAIRRYLEDYGYFGLYGIMFSMGFLFGLFFNATIIKKGFILVVYGIIIDVIIEIAIEDKFFMTIISNGMVLLLIALYICYLFFVDKKYFCRTIKYFI
jgi:oligosaccharide repeat unit polymerase